jgi:hypothetical protein
MWTIPSLIGLLALSAVSIAYVTYRVFTDTRPRMRTVPVRALAARRPDVRAYEGNRL